MEARSDSEALHERARGMVRAFGRGEPMPEPFDSLAADLARFQAAHVPGYRRLCEAHGVRPAALAGAGEAPAVPTDAFRFGSVFAFDPGDAVAVFRTSGTSTARRGEHRMRDLGTYDAAAVAFGRAMLAAGLELPVVVLVVGPSPLDAPDSSLAHMCALLASDLGTPDTPERTFFVRSGTLDLDALRRRIEGLSPEKPALVLGTSLALLGVVDEVGASVWALPPESRVMQTGGFKGRSREADPKDLRHAIARAFSIGEASVVSEYGMTELSSQFWEPVRRDPGASHGVYVEPPWARVIPVDPETLAPVAEGEVGIARIEDLANVDSAFAILTHDRVRRAGRGFELLGRLHGATPRGCSLALEEILAAHGPRSEGPR